MAKKGDKIIIHVEATVNKEIVVGANGKSLEILFVDTTQAANWWLELTDRFAFEKPIKPGEKLVFDATFDIKTKGVSKASAGGCNLVLSSAPEQKEEVTFKTTKFTYKIER